MLLFLLVQLISMFSLNLFICFITTVRNGMSWLLEVAGSPAALHGNRDGSDSQELDSNEQLLFSTLHVCLLARASVSKGITLS